MRSGFARASVLLAAIVLGLVTATLIYFRFFGPGAGRAELAPVVTAGEYISANTVLSPRMLKVELVPKGSIEEGAYTSMAQANDRVTVTPFQPDEQILAERVTDKVTAFGLAGVVPPGRRAMTMTVDSADAVSGLLQPGDHVDVVAAFTEGSDSLAKTILQDVVLLAVNASLKPQPKVEGTAPTAPKPGQSTATSVTIAVTPSEAERLVAAQYKGKLKIGLRGKNDPSLYTTSGASMTSVLGLRPPPGATASQPPAVGPRVVVTASGKTARQPPTQPEPFRPPALTVAPIQPNIPAGAGTGIAGHTIRVIKGTKVEEVVVGN